MIVEPYRPYIEALLQAEPWRAGDSTLKLCTGHLDYDGSPYWVCEACGRIGSSTFQLHLQVQHPGRVILDFFRRAAEFFGSRT